MTTFFVGKTFIVDDGALVKTRKQSDLYAFFKFESLPFVEETTLELMNSDGTQPPIIEDGAFGNGCRFRPQSIFSFPVDFRSDNVFTIGFWLQPSNILPTISASTGEIVYYRVALFDRAEYQYSAGSGLVSISNGSFCFYEECRDDNKNILKIHLFGSDESEVIIVTPVYECGQMHHFWIVYNGISGEFLVYIDGVQRTIIIEEGSIPSRLNMPKGLFMNFNKSAIGYNTLLRTNTGLIDELVIIGQSISDEEVIGRHINYGTEFAVDETLRWRQEVYQSFGFDDPTALQINAIYSNGTNIYAGRSDGKIFKGDRLMWETRKDFSNPEEEQSLKKSLLSEESIIDFSTGALKISKASVQIK